MRRPFRKTALASILFAGAVLAVAITVDAQQPEKTRWIGYLTGSGSLPNQAFVQGLRDLGWVEGKNIAIEYRPHAGRNDLLPGLAAELVQLNADVILAPGTFAALTAKQLIKTTPIVMLSSDPVGSGIVASRGNVTGLSNVQVELGGKRLEILKEAFPKVSRVAVLLRSGGPGSEQQMKEIEIAARSLHIQVQPTGVEEPSGFERAFSTLK